MAFRSLSLGWCFTLAALIVSAAGCNCGGDPQPPPNAELPDAALSKVEVSRTANVPADGRESVTITVTVVNSEGAALAGRTVRLEVSGEGNTLAPASGQTNPQGVLTATLASTRAGTKKVKASVETEGGPVVLTSQPTVEFVSAQAQRLAFLTNSIQATAGAPLSPVVEVELLDTEGRRLATSTAPVTVALATGPAGAQLEGTTTVNAVNGVASFSNLIIKKAGTGYSLKATSATFAEATSPTFEVVPGAPAGLQLTGPASVTAGVAAAFQVSVVDAYANVARGYTGSVRFTSSDAQAVLPGNYTFTAGDAGQKSFPSVTLRTVGSQTVTVTDTSIATFTATHNVTVNAGAATRLELAVPTGPVTAGTGFTVTVTAYDAVGNVATGFTGAVQFTSSDAQAVLPASFTFGAGDAGTASFPVELRTAGEQTLSLVHGLSGSPVTVTKTVVAASPTRLAFAAQPSNGTVRTTLGAVRVVIQDAYGNTVPASSPQVSVGLSGSNTAATLSGTRSVTPASGEASFTDLSVDQEGTDFRLVASAGTLTQATSTVFTIIDNIAPATTSITATTASSSSVRVSWTAVGDDGILGQAAGHELRYATTPITNITEFNAATPVTLSPPQAPGTPESAVVTGLTFDTDHYFALRVSDGAGNFSLSNSARVPADACLNVTCTPPATTCSADGRSVVSYTSACVVSGGVGVCQNTPTATTCQSYETCNAGSCGPVTAGSQAGRIIISEFSALGSEFIELHNTTGADVDVHGYTFRNAAGQEVDIRAPSDPNGTAGTPVVVAAGSNLYGIANPSGAIPGGVGFVYGAPGTPFALADTGDAVALYAAPPAGNLQDAVDFRAYKTNPNVPLTMSDFVGFAGSSTQVDPATLSAAGNDTATNWCVSFYGSGVRGSRVTNTAGAANGSCKVAVINEFYIDAPGGDNGLVFIELAGPGGSVIGGARLTDVEGLNGTQTAGEYNLFGPYTLPATTRFPADGILLLADLGSNGQTQVPNFVAGVDIGLNDVDLENGGGDAVQLINAAGTALLDTVGQDTAGGALNTNTATNGLPMYEGGTAFYISTTGSWSGSLARSPGSADTDNNRNDFRTDPSPTPGLPNDLANFTVTRLFPDDGPATAGASGIVITGTDLAPGTRAQFGNNGVVPCSVSSPTSATCNAVSNASNAVGIVNVVFTAADSVRASGPAVLNNGFTYTGTENETNNVLEADFCNLQFPTEFSVVRSAATPLIYGRIFEAGVTEAAGAPSGIKAEVGYGNNGSDPRSNNSWKFFPADYNTQSGNDDEFMGSFTAPATAATYAYTYRFSQDNGLKWTYCDKNGAGSNTNPELIFEAGQLGVMTVTP